MAIVAASASLSLVGLRRNSDLNDVIDRVKYFDGLTRQQATRSGRPLKLTFDHDAIQRTAAAASPDDQPLNVMRLYPDGWAIERVLVEQCGSE